MFSNFKTLGLAYGNHYQGINEICANDTEAVSAISLPDDTIDNFTLPPSLIDNALQTIINQ